MNKREVLIILNRMKDIVDSTNDEIKLVLNKNETTILTKYLLALKYKNDQNCELITEISSLIEKNKRSF